MGIDTPEEKNLQVNQMNNNYFATLDDDVENDEGVGHTAVAIRTISERPTA